MSSDALSPACGSTLVPVSSKKFFCFALMVEEGGREREAPWNSCGQDGGWRSEADAEAGE